MRRDTHQPALEFASVASLYSKLNLALSKFASYLENINLINKLFAFADFVICYRDIIFLISLSYFNFIHNYPL